MKSRFLSVMTCIMVLSQGSIISTPSVVQNETEIALMRVLSKYSTVFRLVPLRISQMLQVITSYPATQIHARAELLQIVIQRMHEKYRTLQQLQSRVMELAEQADKTVRLGVYARSMKLLDALKKNQITLISTLSVLDAECIRALKSAELVKRDKDAFTDRAYIAAKEALKPNQMDTLITMLASGETGIGDSSDGGSVRQEIRKLRDEVSQLSAQLQAKALIEGAAAAERPFEDKVRDLSNKQLATVEDAQSALAGVEITEPTITWKKYSLRYLKTVPGLFADAAATLQSRAQRFHSILFEKVSAAWGAVTSGEWYGITKDALVGVWETVVALVHRIFTDAGKAADHVATRATEAKESMPYAASAASGVICAVVTWIAESWIALGHKVFAFLSRVTGGLQTVICDLYADARSAVTGSDAAMREFACTVCVKASVFYKTVFAAVSAAVHIAYQKMHEQWMIVFGSRQMSSEDRSQESEKSVADQQPVKVMDRLNQHLCKVFAQVREYSVAGISYVRTGFGRVAEVVQALYNKAYMSLVAVTAQETAL